MPEFKSVSAYPSVSRSAYTPRSATTYVPPMSTSVTNKEPYRDPAWEWLKKAVPLLGATIKATSQYIQGAFANPLPMPETNPTNEPEVASSLYEMLFQKPAPAWLTRPPSVRIPFISEALSGRK